MFDANLVEALQYKINFVIFIQPYVTAWSKIYMLCIREGVNHRLHYELLLYSRSVYSQATSDIELESQSSELQSDCESNDQQQGEAERPVGDGHDKGVACTSSEDDGKPAFQQLPHANQVYEASTTENPPVNQQNDSYTQGSSDINQ